MAALHGLWDAILRTNNAEDIQGYIAKGGALTASIEAIGACPGSSPRTIEHGLWAKPTVLDNVETFANVPRIIRGGAKWYCGPSTSPGTKAFALNTCLIEVPWVPPFKRWSGGTPDGKEFKAVQIGGPFGGRSEETIRRTAPGGPDDTKDR